MRLEYKIGIFLIGFIAGFFVLKFTLAYLFPFILALLVAILIEPLVNFFERWLHLKRGLAVALVLAIVLFIFTVFIVAGVSRIYVELEKLSKNFPSYDVLLKQYQWIMSQNEELKNLAVKLKLSPGQEEAFNHILEDIYAFVTDNFRFIVSQIFGFLTALPNMIAIFFISIIATFFISRDRQMLARVFWKLFPESWQKKLKKVKNELIVAVIGFIRAETILVSITTVVTIVGLEILGADYALIIGFSSGLLDLIPVVGPSLIFIPWAIYCMVTGNFTYGISLLFLYGVIAVIRQVAEAKIIGKNIGVHPLAALISMYVGLKIFGVSGVFIGPAVVIITKALYRAGVITLSAAKE